MSNTNLVSPTRISASIQAHECYNLLCGRRKDDDSEIKTKRKLVLKSSDKPVFNDTVQAFYVAAVIGHLLQQGERYNVQGKVEELISRQQWERKEKEDLRKALTFLVKLEYHQSEPDEVLQVVAELAERGIIYIRDRVLEEGEFDSRSLEIINQLREQTEKREPLE